MSSDSKAGLVVVLEDDAHTAHALSVLLEDWGYECVLGDTFDAVLPTLAGRMDKVGAIVSDYHLADGVTGVEAAKTAARLGVSAPVLLLTGTLHGASRRHAQAEGFRFMEKPVAPARLRSWLHQRVDIST